MATPAENQNQNAASGNLPPNTTLLNQADNTQARSDSTPAQTLKVKVHGEEKVFTVEEAIPLIQKAVSADARYQEAATIRKEAEAAMVKAQAFDDLKALKGSYDEAKFRNVAKALDMDDATVEALIRNVQSGETDDGASSPPPKAGGAQGGHTPPVKQTPVVPPLDGTIPFSQLDPEVKGLLVTLEQGRQEKELSAALAKDDVLGYTIKKRPETQTEFLDEATKAFRRRVKEAPKGTTRAQLVADAVAEVRAVFKRFVTLANPTPAPGLGPAPGEPHQKLHPTKRPDRVRASDPRYSDYIADLIQYHQSDDDLEVE